MAWKGFQDKPEAELGRRAHIVDEVRLKHTIRTQSDFASETEFHPYGCRGRKLSVHDRTVPSNETANVVLRLRTFHN